MITIKNFSETISFLFNEESKEAVLVFKKDGCTTTLWGEPCWRKFETPEGPFFMIGDRCAKESMRNLSRGIIKEMAERFLGIPKENVRTDFMDLLKNKLSWITPYGGVLKEGASSILYPP